MELPTSLPSCCRSPHLKKTQGSDHFTGAFWLLANSSPFSGVMAALVSQLASQEEVAVALAAVSDKQCWVGRKSSDSTSAPQGPNDVLPPVILAFYLETIWSDFISENNPRKHPSDQPIHIFLCMCIHVRGESSQETYQDDHLHQTDMELWK